MFVNNCKCEVEEKKLKAKAQTTHLPGAEVTFRAQLAVLTCFATATAASSIVSRTNGEFGSRTGRAVLGIRATFVLCCRIGTFGAEITRLALAAALPGDGRGARRAES